MTHTQPTPQADTPHTRCLFYRRECGLPAVIDPETGRITMRAAMIGAVMMPTDLALAVRTELERRTESDRHGGTLPIIGHPRAHMWTFLIRSDLRASRDPSDLARLFRARVVVIRDGDIGLPSPRPPQPTPIPEHHQLARVWVSTPTTKYRPSGTAVLDCVRHCLTTAERAALPR
ncbi:DNA-directed RNA polymerase subunit beta [Nocardia sp. NPDC055029]